MTISSTWCQRHLFSHWGQKRERTSYMNSGRDGVEGKKEVDSKKWLHWKNLHKLKKLKQYKCYFHQWGWKEVGRGRISCTNSSKDNIEGKEGIVSKKYHNSKGKGTIYLTRITVVTF